MKNVSLNLLRNSHSEKMRPFEDGFVEADTTDLTDNLISAENLNGLSKLIMELPDNMREVIYLKLALGFSSRETAELLGLTEENIRVLLYRGRKSLVANLSKG